MDTLQYIRDKFNLPEGKKVEIPNVSRKDLGTWCRELGFTQGAEIGVEKGIFSEILTLQSDGLMQLHCVDPWKLYDGYNHFGKDMEKNYKETIKRLEDYPNIVIHRKTSMEALEDFEDGSLDFVYIDAHHGFQHVINDICEWSKKVRVGGILAGDDYFLPKRPYANRTHHVVEAVDAFTRAYKVPLFILGSNTEGVRDKVRSWMFVKNDDYFNFQF